MGLDGPEDSSSTGHPVPEEQPLSALLPRRRFAYSEVARMGARVADALARGHAQGDPHRGLTPDTVMISREGRARLIGPSGRPVPDAYLSPEQVRGEPLGAPADVYVLGLVLLEAATGRQVYPGSGPSAARTRLFTPPMVPNDVPGPLARALLAMTQTDPAARPSARRAADMLAGISAGAPSGVPASGLGLGRKAAIGLPVLVLLVLLAVTLVGHRGAGSAAAGGSAAGGSPAGAGGAPAGHPARPSLPAISLPESSDLPSGLPHPSGLPSELPSGLPDASELPQLSGLPHPSGLPEIGAPQLPKLPSSSSVAERILHAWRDFTHWLSGLR